MASIPDVRAASAPPPAGGARRLLRWLSTSNPFYAVSAALFLAGLWLSFGGQSGDVSTWALLSGLAGYTLLLAGTAWLLVRCGVWDDVRTLLLLVVLMFLATSVTFDEVFVFDRVRGTICYVAGLLFAVSLSEALLRGSRLRLPLGFRLPYYLILSLFFLYPLILGPHLNDPHDETLLWLLAGFPAVAGLAFLTLLPAVRRGPAYIREGSPWRLPLYPWALFGLLALAVPARGFLLCWSMHLLTGTDSGGVIFGPYFLVPFGLALGVLLLEAGGRRRRRVQQVAMAVPVGLLVLATVGHRPGGIYGEFLGLFTTRLGGDPLSLTLIASAGFYAYASLRRVPRATETLTAVLGLLAVVGPDTLDRGELVAPQPLPLLLVAILQLSLGVERRSLRRCLCGYGALLGTVAIASQGMLASPLREAALAHLALLGMLVLGAAFDDRLAKSLRLGGAALLALAAVGVLFAPFVSLPSGAALAYPVVVALLLALYGVALGHRPSLAAGGAVLLCWLAVAGWGAYRSAREVVTGLDQIVLSLVVFALAVLISLAKAGLLPRWWQRWRKAWPLSGQARQ